MRAKEFLLEYNRDITRQKYADLVNNRNGYPKKIDDLFQAAIDAIEESDPTQNKQYTEWAIRGYINRVFWHVEDIFSIGATFLAMFHKLKVHKKLPPEIADINRIKTKREFDRVYDIIDDLYKENVRLSPLPEGKTKLIKKLQNVTVVIPEDEAAACYWGEGTKWCTSIVPGRFKDAHTKNLFDTYKSGNLYVLIPKNPKHDGEKYQLFFRQWPEFKSTKYSKGKHIEVEFVDEHNNQITNEVGKMDLHLIFDRFGDELRDWLVNIDENAEDYVKWLYGP